MKTETQLKAEHQQLKAQWQALSERIAQLADTLDNMTFQQADARIAKLQAELETLQRKTLIRLGLEK